jgi:catechol 2,3-dioxygenase-like lactoylglutathione lyase family enzyme
MQAMGYTLDHIVILVRDLGAAIDDYSALGFTVVPGGEHTGGATHNALIAFADGSYFELIAFKQPAPDHNWWRHVAVGEGLIDAALLPQDIAADLAAARGRGLPFEGPFPGGRARPDGQQIAWQIGRPTTPDLPFLCADVTPRALRVPGGAAQQHANGASGVANLAVVVADLEQSSARYQALLGAPPAAQPSAAGLAVGTHAAAFALGAGTLTLIEPDSGAGEPLRERLEARGEGPFAITLRGAFAGEGVLDPARTHGVWIWGPATT